MGHKWENSAIFKIYFKKYGRIIHFVGLGQMGE
jgi:hypothetical protein